MNSTMAMPLSALQTDGLAFLAFPAKRAAQQVSGTTEDLFQNIATIINGILSDVLSKRTAAQYCATRDEHFGTYMQVMLGLGKLISATVQDQVIDRLRHESFSEMEAEFRDYGAAAFGTEVKDQALFTVWSLRKTIALVADNLCGNDLNPELAKADREMAMQFTLHILYGRFHLDCLTMSLRESTPIYPEVLECISDGLRNVVNAYAAARRACDLRHPHQEEEEMVVIEFDDEEKELLAFSMKDAYLEV